PADSERQRIEESLDNEERVASPAAEDAYRTTARSDGVHLILITAEFQVAGVDENEPVVVVVQPDDDRRPPGAVRRESDASGCGAVDRNAPALDVRLAQRAV